MTLKKPNFTNPKVTASPQPPLSPQGCCCWGLLKSKPLSSLVLHWSHHYETARLVWDWKEISAHPKGVSTPNGVQAQKPDRHSPFNPEKHQEGPKGASAEPAKPQHSELPPQKSTHLMNSLPGSTCNLNSLLLGCLTMKCKCKRLGKGQMLQLGMGGGI